MTSKLSVTETILKRQSSMNGIRNNMVTLNKLNKRSKHTHYLEINPSWQNILEPEQYDGSIRSVSYPLVGGAIVSS
jgi:hypothetical protein